MAYGATLRLLLITQRGTGRSALFYENMSRRWNIEENYWGGYTVEEQERNNGGELAIFLIFSFFFSILAAILVAIASFVAVGVFFGLFTSINNYIKGVRLFPLKIGKTIILAWNSNERKMRDFFDDAVKYDKNHDKHGRMVKTFYVMSGIGVIFVGTLLMPIWIIIHSIIVFFVCIYKRISCKY